MGLEVRAFRSKFRVSGLTPIGGGLQREGLTLSMSRKFTQENERMYWQKENLGSSTM